MRGPEQAGAVPVVRVYTLGGFRVVVADHVVEEHAWRRRTARQLFKALLTRPGRRMTRDEAIELFWPESDPEAAATNVRSTLYAMRHALELPNSPHIAGVVFSDAASVWLTPGPALWTDADGFEQMVADAWRSPDPLPLLEEASKLYAGDYLPDDLYDEWASERRDTLRRTWIDLQFGLAKALEARADIDAALQPLQRVLRADPCEERAAGEQMKLLARHGRRAEAERVYQRLVQTLRNELDVEPSADTLELHRRLTAGEVIAPQTLPATLFRCSYPFPAPTELVGRAAELSALAEILDGGRSVGRTALIAAPAGTGKSALMGQIVRRAQSQGVLCLAGGCYEERGAVPLGPFHDALVDFLLAQPRDALLTQLGSSVDDLATVVPELRYQLKRPPDGTSSSAGSMDRMRAFGAIHACLRALAERGPVLVCLEDLHAADEATLQLLHYLARQTRRLRLVLLATYRSDEVPAEHPLAQTVAAMLREQIAQRLTLPALGRGDTDRLAASLLQASPSVALSETLYATTGGNPLFLEQLVLALSEAGYLERKSGMWYATAKLQGVPQIVNEVIADRLLRLDAGCRDMLAMASVLGQTFEHEVVLAAMEPADETALLQDLDRAIAAHILQETAAGYAFRHVLLRDALYWSLSGPRRTLLHARAGTLLEHFYGPHADDRAAELAHHFVLAGVSSAARSKALHYSLEAGRRAHALSLTHDALEHFSRALQCIAADASDSRLMARLEALEGRGLAERGLGLLPAAVATMRLVLDLSDDPIRRARVRGEIASALLHNDPEGALAELGSAGADLERTGEAEGAAAIRLRLQSFEAMYWFLAGQYTRVLALGQQMLPVASSLGDVRALARARSVISWAHIGAGQVAAAVQESDQLLQLARGSTDKVEVAHAEVDLGLEYYLGGEFDKARRYLEHARELYQQSANDVWLSNTLQLLARVSLAQGDLRGARAEAESALQLASGQQERWAAECHDVLGNIYTLAAEYGAAESSFQEALAIRRRIGHTAGILDSLVGLGRLSVRVGDLDAAERRYRQALDAAQGMEACPPVVAAWRCLGRLYCRRGDVGEAALVLTHAGEFASTISASMEYAPTLLAIAELEAQTGNLNAAQRYVDEALERTGSVEFRIEAYALCANLLRATQRDQAAAEAAAAALDLAERFGAPFLLGIAHLITARTSTIHKIDGAALQHYTLALQNFALSGSLEHAETEREIAELTTGARDSGPLLTRGDQRSQ